MMTGKAGFFGFAERALIPLGQSPARHHRALIEALDDIAEGRCDRLMVQMPPGSAKSTYGSVLFPAYFLSRHPGSQIIATAHTASLADHFGRLVRGVINTHGEGLKVSLTKDSRSAKRFSLEDGGGYFAAGVRGPITGRRADLILIDDPVKSWAEAESPAFREALYDWYRAELTARLKPNGRIVLMMTRWHEDDLAGRLMRTGGQWQSLTLPALATTNDMLGRAVGEALWPAWQDVEALVRRRAEVGERAFSAMYQQNPRPPAMSLFNTKTIRIIAQVPLLKRSVRAWDLAATLPGSGRDPDYTVGLKIGLTTDNMIVVLDIIRLQATPFQVETAIAGAAKSDGTKTIIALPQDPGQAGVSQINYLKRNLVGYPIISTIETGAKITRAMPAAAQMDAGNIMLLAAPWNENFIAEIAAFPDSHKDDQVDAFSRAVGTLATGHQTATHKLSVSLFGR
jgi:predicted phage terminase large subunit-like protein